MFGCVSNTSAYFLISGPVSSLFVPPHPMFVCLYPPQRKKEPSLCWCGRYEEEIKAKTYRQKVVPSGAGTVIQHNMNND